LTKVKHPAKNNKKEARKAIAKKLEKALADLKPAMGKKDFEDSIKKASKLFTIKASPAVKVLKKAKGKTKSKAKPKISNAAPKIKTVEKPIQPESSTSEA